MKKTIFGLVAVAAMAGVPAHAAIDNYFASLLGVNEVNPGDPDGFGAALVSIDNVSNKVSWSILALDIAPVTLAHIHQAGAGANGPVRVDFNAMLTGTNLFDADLASITPATASGFYVNVHTGQFPGGAIRGQLSYIGTVTAPVPEPETYALMLAGLGVVGWFARRRKI